MLRPNIRHGNNKQHNNNNKKKRRNISRRPNDKVGFFSSSVKEKVFKRNKRRKVKKYDIGIRINIQYFLFIPVPRFISCVSYACWDAECVCI